MITIKKYHKNIYVLSMLAFLVISALSIKIANENTWKTDENRTEESTHGGFTPQILYEKVGSVYSYNAELPMKQGPVPAGIKAQPKSGNVSVLAMPVYFSDQSYSTASSTIDSRWDGAGLSVRNYYLEQSFSQIYISVNTLPWVLAPMPISYYGSETYETRQIELASWLLNYWDSAIDYNLYDYVYAVYAGADQIDDTHLWPCVWTFYTSIDAGDSVSYKRFGFVGEFSAMGTYAHEFGHSLGLIDYYNPGGSPYYAGKYELMDQGNYNDNGNHPSGLGLYSKMELGWITEDQVATIETGGFGYLNIYRLESPNLPANMYYGAKIVLSSTIFFLVEFRDNVGYDAYLPDYGVMWSCIDLTKGSTEGRLYYYNDGDRSSPNLPNACMRDADTTNSKMFVNWLIGSFELSVCAHLEYSDYYVVAIDCYRDWGTQWETTSVPAGNYLYWNLTLSAGDVIYLVWDTPLEGSGSDMRILKKNSGAWSTVFQRDDIWQDSVLFRATQNDDYQIRIINDNSVFSMTLYYKIFLLSAPSISLLNYNGPTNVWIKEGETTKFRVSIDARNYLSAWDSNVYASISLPYGVTLDTGETTNKNLGDLCKGVPRKVTWNLATTASFEVSSQFSISLSGTYSSDILYRYLYLKVDNLPPTLTILNESVVYTNTNSWIKWIASDTGIGLDSYQIFVNDVYHASINNPNTQEYWFPSYNWAAQGQNKITVFASDKFNQSTNRSITLIYDTSEPTITMESDDRVTTNRQYFTYQLKVKAEDTLSPISKVRVIWDNGWFEKEMTLVGGKYVAELDLDTYSSFVDLTIEAYDAAGNVATKYVSISIIYDSAGSAAFIIGLGIVGVAGAAGVGIFVVRKKKLGNRSPAEIGGWTN